MNPSVLTHLQLDAIREISGIGAGHAATALSELVSRPIRLEVPTIEVIGLEEIARVFGGPEQIVGAVYARLAGEIEGGVLCIAAPDAIRTVTTMLGGDPVPLELMPDVDNADALVRAAGTLIDSYLRAVSEMTGLAVCAAGLEWAYDMAGALFEAVVAETGMRADHAVLARTAFIDAGRTVEAAFFFVPDPDSLTIMLARLGLA